MSHRIINTNAIAIGPKTPTIWPAMIDEIVDFFQKNKISIIQLPCPEQMYYGLIRSAVAKNDIDKPNFRKICKKIAEEMIENMEQYIKNNKIIETNDMGILIEEINKRIGKNNKKC